MSAPLQSMCRRPGPGQNRGGEVSEAHAWAWAFQQQGRRHSVLLHCTQQMLVLSANL